MGSGLGIQLGGKASKIIQITYRAGGATAAAVFKEGTYRIREAFKERLKNLEKNKEDGASTKMEKEAANDMIEKTSMAAALPAAQIAAEVVLELSAETAANEVKGIIQLSNMKLDPIEEERLSKQLVQNTTGHNELKEFIQELGMSDIFSMAAKNEDFRSGQSNQKKIQLENYLKCLEEIETKLKAILEWLEKHKNNAVSYSVENPLLTSIIVQLIAGMGNLKRLADDVEELNKYSKPITESHIDSLKRGVGKVIKAFGKLSYYRLGMTSKESDLFPKIMDSQDTEQWESKLQL